MRVLVVLLVFVGAMIAASILNGWALVQLWGWFMVPLGLPVLSLPWAIGIAVVVSFLTNHNEPRKSDDVDVGKAIGHAFLRPVISVGVGWIVHQYMK